MSPILPIGKFTATILIVILLTFLIVYLFTFFQSDMPNDKEIRIDAEPSKNISDEDSLRVVKEKYPEVTSMILGTYCTSSFCFVQNFPEFASMDELKKRAFIIARDTKEIIYSQHEADLGKITLNTDTEIATITGIPINSNLGPILKINDQTKILVQDMSDKWPEKYTSNNTPLTIQGTLSYQAVGQSQKMLQLDKAIIIENSLD